MKIIRGGGGGVVLLLVMGHNPAHDLFSIGHFLCHVRVVGCCNLRNSLLLLFRVISSF